MAQIVCPTGHFVCASYRSGFGLATGMRDESDALETLQFGARHRPMSVIHRMCDDWGLQPLGTAGGLLKLVSGFGEYFSEEASFQPGLTRDAHQGTRRWD